MSANLTFDPRLSAGTPEQAKAVAPAVPPSKPTTGGASSASLPNLPNPRLYIEPGLNRVVLEFFDSSGQLTNTIPSLKQLEAYRLAALSGQPVAGGGSGSN